MMLPKLSTSLSALILVMSGLISPSEAAVTCDVISASECGQRKVTHKLPQSVGETIYASGFHGGTMYVKLQSRRRTVPESDSLWDLTYNFNLGSYDGTYWVIMKAPFGRGGTFCYAVYKNCDVHYQGVAKGQALEKTYILA